MDFQIRQIKREDIQKVQKLIETCGPHVAAYNIYAYWMLSEYCPSTSFAVFEKDAIIGVITAIQSIEKETAFIWQICVDKNHRGKNIAYNLIEKVVNSCRDLKLKTVELSITDTNEASLNLFAKFAKDNSLELKHLKDETIGSTTDKVFQIKLD